MSETAAQPCGARFFDEAKRDLGRALDVTKRASATSTLTVLDVAGSEPELARVLSLLDRARLWIQCEDAGRTSYIFRWASGYGNGERVRIQGVLEPRTGREVAIIVPPPKPPAPPPPPATRGPASWDANRPKRRW